MKIKSVLTTASVGIALLGYANTASSWISRPNTLVRCPQVATRQTQLCLALDGSGSISGGDYTKIKKAVAEAIRSDSTVPQDRSVTLSVVQFSDDAQVIVSGTVIDSQTTADRVAALVENMKQPSDGTAVGDAIDLCASQFNFTSGARHVIDVFTDGGSNTGIEPGIARQTALARGVNVINALLVGSVDWNQVNRLVWPASSPAQSSSVSVFPSDGFAIYLKDFSAFPQTFAAMIRTETLMITSSDPGYAIAVPGTVDQQVAAINQPPKAFSTTWRSVYRKRDVPATQAFSCSQYRDPLDQSGTLGLAYVSAALSKDEAKDMAGNDEVTFDNCHSAFYRFTFSLPKEIKEVCLDGIATVDDAGVVYLNGGRISASLSPGDVGGSVQDTRDRTDAQGKPVLNWPTLDQFGTNLLSLFREGLNELVFGVAGDLSPYEPTGLEFKAKVLVKAAPHVTLFQIENGAASTNKRYVTLNNAASERPTHYMASESSKFTRATWQPYSTAPTFKFYSSSPGVKTVYFKTKGINGESAVMYDTITFTGS